MPGRLEFDFSFRKPEAAQATNRGAFRILVLADLSGREGREEVRSDLSGVRPVAIDVDNFDDVLTRFSPSMLYAAPGAEPTRVGFKDLDDFHPDALFRSVSHFQALRDTRKRLLDPATSSETAVALRGDRANPAEPAPEAPAQRSDDALFERILGRPKSDAQAEAQRKLGLHRFLQEVVKPHLAPEKEPDQDELVASIDSAIAEQMRSLLHDPGFKSVESTWTGLRELITRVETGEDVIVHVLDVSASELRADLNAAGAELDSSATHRWLVEQAVDTPGISPWSVVVGAFSVSTNEADTLFLAKLGAVASRAKAPFLAQGEPSVLGCDSITGARDPKSWGEVTPEWQALRESPIGGWIGLTLPRVLMRLPYGKATDEIDSFTFEELTDASRHEDYLWGNSALACATLLARSFLERGWSFEPGDHLDLEDLPAHVAKVDGESRLQPCAEVLIPESAGEAMLGQGVIPILSFAHESRARVLRFQSIAAPPSPLPFGRG